MLEYLKGVDTRLFLYLNGRHNGLFDTVMFWASNQWFWVPFYVCLLIFMVGRFGRLAYYYLFFIVVLEVASDQLSSHVIKNLVKRPRPSHVDWLKPYIHLSDAGPGGLYGFVSGHASNSFALAVFLMLTLPSSCRWLKGVVVGWAILVSYSRVYNGVHYPGDVVCGGVLGALLALLAGYGFSRYLLFYLLMVRRWKPQGREI